MVRWDPLGVIWWLEAQAGERVFRFQLPGSADSDGSQETGEDMRVLWGLEGLGLDGVPVIPMTFPLPPQPGFGTSSTRCGAAGRRLSQCHAEASTDVRSTLNHICVNIFLGNFSQKK